MLRPVQRSRSNAARRDERRRALARATPFGPLCKATGHNRSLGPSAAVPAQFFRRVACLLVQEQVVAVCTQCSAWLCFATCRSRAR